MKTYDIGYFSSPDRGLECLLNLLPDIEKRLGRKVKAVWAYGWNSFDSVHANNPEMMRYKWTLVRKMREVGLEDKGRLSHEDLAKLMKDTKVWAYPTLFTEISCITAMKAQLAGCYPVVNAIAALDETVQFGTKLRLEELYTDKSQQQEFVAAIVEALTSKTWELGEASKWVADTYSWSKIAEGWDEACTA